MEPFKKKSDDGRTLYAKPYAGGPKKHVALRDRRTCTSHETPLLYSPAGREVRAGQHLSTLGRQSSMYKRLPIGKFPQLGPYMVPFCTKAHNQRE